MGVFLDNSIKNVVGGLNVRYFFCLTFSMSVCPSNEGASVLVGTFKSFKQKFHSHKPIKTHFFNQLIF
ncbi:uncharacterized protein HPF21_0773 [Helicobacter pylori]|nr:uncharacterized protein HPF21_0773 [Helicobacter pylori]